MPPACRPSSAMTRRSLGQHAPRAMSWPQLRQQVASLALHLQAQGVRPGDRVVAYLPNIPEAMVAFLATVSIGGVWSICAPDMGSNAVLDRFRQIEPAVLIGCDAVIHGGRQQDRLAVVAQLRAALPTVRHLLMLDHRGTLAQAERGTAACRLRRGRLPATMPRPAPSRRCGCRSTIRCGSSIPAAPPACPSRSCTAMAARCWWAWRCSVCTTTSAAATTPTARASAFTGTARPAG